jgi:hypothetical protein
VSGCVGAVLLLACASPVELEAAVEARGLHVRADASIEAVRVWDGARLLVDERLPEPLGELHLAVPWEAGRALRVEARTRRGAAEAVVTAGPAPCSLRAGASPSAALDVTDRVAALAGAPLWLEVVTHRAGPVELELGGEVGARELRVGEAWTLSRAAAPGDVLALRCGGAVTTAQIVAPVSELEEVKAALKLDGVAWPADRAGRPDPSRPGDAVPLPSPVWEAFTRRAGLGWRARDPHAPWAWVGVRLVWEKDEPVDVIVRLRMLDADGAPLLAFRPQMRGAEDGTGTVSSLVRLRPGPQAVVLPVFVEEAALVAGRDEVVRRRLELSLPGEAAPVLQEEATLPIWRAGSAVVVGAAVGLGVSVLGLGLLLVGALRWLPRQPTELLTLAALYAALLFVAGTVAQVVGIGVATLLGPYGVLLTALLDDLLQTALLATLLVARPAPGVASLVTAIGWTLRAVALGTVGPLELLILTMRVALLEAWLWGTGVSRGRPGALRLLVAMVGVQAAATAIGLCWTSLLYRLTFSSSYVLLLLVGPGVLYPAIAVLATRRVATSLREIAP